MPPFISRRQLLADVGLATLAVAGTQVRLLDASDLTVSHAGPPSDDRLSPAFEALDRFVVAHMRELNLPGMTLVLAGRDGILRVSTYGYADVKSRLPVTPATMFEIGSISKSFVAMALMQLRDEGKFDPRRPLTDYMPWVKVASTYEPITAHHLLSHSAGLPDGLGEIPLFPRGPLTQPWTGSPPGTHFVYSNMGYMLLGDLLSTLDGRPFAECMQHRMLDPLGMSATVPVITNAVRQRLAVGYQYPVDDRVVRQGSPLTEAPWIEVGDASGSIASTPADMGAYIRMLLNQGVGPHGRLISEESFTLATTPAIDSPFWGEKSSYGYGYWVNRERGQALLRHTGGMVAFSSALRVDIAAGRGAFASTNASIGEYRPNLVAKVALDLLDAAARGQKLPPTPASEPPTKVARAADYAGTYTAPDGTRLVLVARPDTLVLRHGDRDIVLERAGEDAFIIDHPDFSRFPLAFGRESGNIVEASYGGRWFAGERYSGPRTFEYPKEWDGYVGHYRNDSPWTGNVRVVILKGRLVLAGQAPLIPLEGGLFRVGEEEFSPERARFDAIVNGKAQRMSVSGTDFYRTFTE